MTAIKKLEEQFIQLVGQVSQLERSKNMRLYHQTKRLNELLKQVNEYNQLEDEEELEKSESGK